MTTRLLYLVGQPGSGKSALMAKLTAPFDRASAPIGLNGVAHDWLTDKVTGQVVAVEIGKRRELFAGTDALPSSIIEKAIPWIETEPYPFLLAEGARLANLRFIKAATASYHVTLALLDHPDAETWRKARAKQIGRDQNPSWVKGRLSASRNLADKLEGTTGVTVLRGHPDDLYEQLAGMLHVTEGTMA